jgi:hypothetical protein
MRRSILAVILGTCVGLAAACGGSDEEEIQLPGPGPGDEDPGDDDSSDPPPPVENPAAVGIGQVCDEANPCPEEAPLCLVFSQTATQGMCTASCGETPIPEGGQAQPPDPNLDMVCPTYSGSGTSICGLGLGGEPGATTQEWACAVLCGTYDTGMGSVELGECPGGLTCGKDQANLCSP